MKKKRNIHKLKCLILAGATRPHGPERRDRLVSALLLLGGVIVKIELLSLVPEVLIDLLLAELGSGKPLVGRLAGRRRFSPRSGRLGIGLRRDGEWSEREFILKVEVAVKDVSDGGGDIGLVSE